MEVKCISECLNRVDNKIFEKSLKVQVKGDSEYIKKHIECKQADIVSRGEYIEERTAVLAVFSQINHIIERFYSNDTEEDLDEEYNLLKQRMLNWYDVSNTKREINDQ